MLLIYSNSYKTNKNLASKCKDRVTTTQNLDFQPDIFPIMLHMKNMQAFCSQIQHSELSGCLGMAMVGPSANGILLYSWVDEYNLYTYGNECEIMWTFELLLYLFTCHIRLTYGGGEVTFCSAVHYSVQNARADIVCRPWYSI